jgi:nicotinamidase-related amidase
VLRSIIPELRRGGMESDLPFGPLPVATAHLCVDMQNVFLERTDWHVPWMKVILPAVVELCSRAPRQTVFTRFRPPAEPRSMPGAWQRYYRRWPQFTVDAMASGLLDLVPPLRALCPPATTVDKATYSAFGSRRLVRWLQTRRTECLIITGVETDVCVLASILSAIDRGYRVIVPLDAVCSSTDEGHDSLVEQYRRRFGQQLETTSVETILRQWPAQ